MVRREWPAVGRMPHVRGLAILLAVGAVLTGAPAAARVGPAATRLVVVVYPDESDGAPGVVQVNRALHATFALHPGERVEIRNEYVHTSRSRDPEFRQAQASLLRQKYAGRKVDLVIAGLSSGLDFVLEHRDDLFPGVPVVFVAVDQREVAARRSQHGCAVPLPEGCHGPPRMAGRRENAARP
ncbi:MAG TPA: hypothetical protein VM597_38760, partial [Gemmataceae bacterium]|nr:hypothetical protein [Gemmataceae bacterium]